MNVENHGGQFISLNSRCVTVKVSIDFATADLYLNIEPNHVYRMANDVFEKFIYSKLDYTFPLF
jgi:hypothetical protein